MIIEQLLESIRNRPSAGIYGIGIASSYLKSMGACLTGGGFCPTNIFKNATSELWAKELLDSDSRFTYCDESTSDSDFMQKSVREGTDITPGAILEYDCVLSSKRQDRDRDIIEQKGGLELDLKQPALWQHNQLAPIGKLIKVLSQDEMLTKCRYALADTELGRDAAVLVKFGALRKSIGFKPSEFSPIEIVKNAQGVDTVRGWHIKKAMGMEGSLVSIPANADANILGVYAKQFDGLATAFSRGELKNDVVKHWAKGLYDLRQVQVSGADLETKTACGCGTKAAISAGPTGVDALKETPCPTADCKGVLDHSGTCVACGYKKKSAMTSGSAGMDVTKGKKCPGCDGDMESGKCKKCGKSCDKSLVALTSKMYGAAPYPAGSFEAIQYDLRGSAKAYLEANAVAVGEAYVDLLATLADSAVVCINPYTTGRKQACYQVEYTVTDGVAAWSGTPAEVTIQPQIIAKSLATQPTFDADRVAKSAMESLHPAKIARALIAKSCIDPEAVAAVREVARMVPVHDLKSSASFESLFTK